MAENYVKVAVASDLKPGDITMAKIGKMEVLIANLDGEFYAIDNYCPHEG